jgi:predicted ABC-type ATPase
MKRNVYIIAGPNGAGKTTFAKEFLPHYAGAINFVNADLIAQGISPFSPESGAFRAGRIMLEEIESLVRRGDDFGFETTLSGVTHLEVIRRLRERGYSAHLFYLWIPNEELAISRIRGRVEEGGHWVPETIVRRRFGRSLHNFFECYCPIVSSWTLFDNSARSPELIAFEKDQKLRILKPDLFSTLLKTYGHR